MARLPNPLRLPRTPLQRWLARDPGLLRAKQAVKTVAACGASLWLFQDTPSPAPIVAAFGAFVFMQSNAGANRRDQMATMLLAGLTILAIACLGGALQQYAWLALGVAAALAAGAYAIRERGSRYTLFPLFGFAIFAVLTGEPRRDDWEAIGYIALASATSWAISFCIYFYVLPENRHRALVAAVRQTYARITVLLRHASRAVREGDADRTRFLPLLRRAIDDNRLARSLLERRLVEHQDRDDAYTRLLDETSDLLKSLRIFIYALDQVSAERAHNTTPVGEQLARSINALREECACLRLDAPHPPNIQRVRCETAVLRDAVLEEARTQPTADTIVLMNASFALDEAASALGGISAVRRALEKLKAPASAPHTLGHPA